MLRNGRPCDLGKVRGDIGRGQLLTPHEANNFATFWFPKGSQEGIHSSMLAFSFVRFDSR